MNFTYEPGRLFHETDGIVDAEILFPAILGGKVWSIDHTYVDPSLRGQGIAGQLLAEVVNRAKEADVQLKPVCTYARQAFFRHEEYQKLAYKD
ncbi:GNAT family N-acetyltransferase [Weissella sagaensis]|jgi:predicted GNAT family acetyltransferase|uniref:GNAT family N-acetyltransferase n=1 Tax=Weissella sagaensis TaxID=2559928 RepID=A0ABW1RU70_9LACO|nr:GNAT family N-acetyltransferase [Weissella sagaensis]KAA8433333.1 N-acetyltransferase [Weissella paramesenteroides]MBU7567261.1 N-acetyltransferase [Weissella hellenica]KAA8439236.1 N-acetyltransferase [Weissella paramesenteroides]QDJ59313.1 N-acetyltransferase [Weissella hellenica]QEA56625.1 N-acetyltransferase [Weissella hellenica]